MYTKSGECLHRGAALAILGCGNCYWRRLVALVWTLTCLGCIASMLVRGATAVVHDRLFERHGRWKSESAKDDYIKDSVESRFRSF